MTSKTIAEFTDAELAKMVRDSIYVQGARFGEGETDARFLIVLAVPYGPDDTVEDLPEAIDAFARLLQDDDWQERSFQVYDHAASQHFYQVSREDCEDANRDCPNCIDGVHYSDPAVAEQHRKDSDSAKEPAS